MPFSARIAVALITIIVASPAIAQYPNHTGCASCGTANAIPVVRHKSGLLNRIFNRREVTIPAGHHVDTGRGNLPGPVASWTDSTPRPPAIPSTSGIEAYAVAPGPMPARLAGRPSGVVRAGYRGSMPDVSTPQPIAPMSPMMPGAVPPVGMYPDPSTAAWHPSGVANSAPARRRGPLSTMLGTSGISRWIEGRRLRRAFKRSAMTGMYNPNLTEAPSWAVQPSY